MTLRHADGICSNPDGYTCQRGKLYGPADGDLDPTVRYVMRCYCPCHTTPTATPGEQP